MSGCQEGVKKGWWTVKISSKSCVRYLGFPEEAMDDAGLSQESCYSEGIAIGGRTEILIGVLT